MARKRYQRLPGNTEGNTWLSSAQDNACLPHLHTASDLKKQLRSKYFQANALRSTTDLLHENDGSAPDLRIWWSTSRIWCSTKSNLMELEKITEYCHRLLKNNTSFFWFLVVFLLRAHLLAHPDSCQRAEHRHPRLPASTTPPRPLAPTMAALSSDPPPCAHCPP